MIIFINISVLNFVKLHCVLLKDLFIKEKWFLSSASRCIVKRSLANDALRSHVQALVHCRLQLEVQRSNWLERVIRSPWCRMLCFVWWQGRDIAIMWQLFHTALSSVASHFYRAMLCIRGTSHGPVSVSVSVCVRLSVCHKSKFY